MYISVSNSVAGIMAGILAGIVRVWKTLQQVGDGSTSRVPVRILRKSGESWPSTGCQASGRTYQLQNADCMYRFANSIARAKIQASEIRVHSLLARIVFKLTLPPRFSALNGSQICTESLGVPADQAGILHWQLGLVQPELTSRDE